MTPLLIVISSVLLLWYSLRRVWVREAVTDNHDRAGFAIIHR
jgi:hypothetical protein